MLGYWVDGQHLTLTFPVLVAPTIINNIAVTNTASMTSSEVTSPLTASVTISIEVGISNVSDTYLPLLSKN